MVVGRVFAVLLVFGGNVASVYVALLYLSCPNRFPEFSYQLGHVHEQMEHLLMRKNLWCYPGMTSYPNWNKKKKGMKREWMTETLNYPFGRLRHDRLENADTDGGDCLWHFGIVFDFFHSTSFLGVFVFSDSYSVAMSFFRDSKNK